MIPDATHTLFALVFFSATQAKEWPDHEKDELIFIANPIEANMPGHWVPGSIVKAILEGKTPMTSTTTKEKPTPKVTRTPRVTKATDNPPQEGDQENEEPGEEEQTEEPGTDAPASAETESPAEPEEPQEEPDPPPDDPPPEEPATEPEPTKKTRGTTKDGHEDSPI
ncbi:uncharacterized protein LOC142977682 isoform X3 [Anticarsia gemmatalis]|uniref:uncharacterized protein LOC142977682 isoform X3 n=1 Tax=Anticarsia gemmatalis TaxID=129554 RepID=UPI003F775BFE